MAGSSIWHWETYTSGPRAQPDMAGGEVRVNAVPQGHRREDCPWEQNNLRQPEHPVLWAQSCRVINKHRQRQRQREGLGRSCICIITCHHMRCNPHTNSYIWNSPSTASLGNKALPARRKAFNKKVIFVREALAVERHFYVMSVVSTEEHTQGAIKAELNYFGICLITVLGPRSHFFTCIPKWDVPSLSFPNNSSWASICKMIFLYLLKHLFKEEPLTITHHTDRWHCLAVFI